MVLLFFTICFIMPMFSFSLLFFYFFLCLLSYYRKFETIQQIVAVPNLRPFNDPWVADILKKHGLEKIKIFLFEPEHQINNPRLFLGLASAVCLPIPVQKSIMFLNKQLLDFPPSFARFALAHELGHIIYQKGLHKIFRLSDYCLREEIYADAFAASIMGKQFAEKILEQFLDTWGDANLNMRIMALIMPTLFRQYA